ncbi:regulator of G protein signaling [Chiua virens]|nr:regulator of G protein signaling [Chiua virens]
MSSDRADYPPQASSSHMMKTTKRGRPYLKDTLDLFATLVVSLQLTTHKQYFRTFPNSFTTDEAAQNLASLKFSQSNRGPDPRDKSRIVTTTTTTTFSMTRDMAKAMCQHFMDARLIENAADQGSNLFKDRGTYVLTPKGLHVLERFISKNGINSDHLQHVFASQPICIKLLHLERRTADDEIIVTQSVITALFRRFVGRQPNYPPQNASAPQDAFQEYHERSKGVQLMDVQEKAQPLLGKATVVHKHCFAAVSALEWLCDFTSVVGREEAAEMAAQFVRFGLIALVSDKRKNNDSAIIFTVRGSAPGGNSPVSVSPIHQALLPNTIYRITDEGKRVAQWDDHVSSPHSSVTNLHERSSLEGSTIEGLARLGPDSSVSAADAKIHRRISMAEKLNAAYAEKESSKEAKASVKSNTDRLNQILEEPSYRALFREFLKANFCEENLAFWMDVEDFKRKFSITSSAQANVPSGRAGKGTPGQAAMEKHHESLIQTAFQIYNKYLAPSSQNELNIDHGLRLDLASYLSEVMTNLNGKSFDGQVDASQASAFNATQLQTLIKLYSRIQTHVLRLMAMDSLPKFIKTPRFIEAKQWLGGDASEDIQFLTSPPAPPGLGNEETGGAYITVSPKATEREQRQHQVPGSSTNS